MVPGLILDVFCVLDVGVRVHMLYLTSCPRHAMTTFERELERQKLLAARTSRRLKALRAGTGLEVVVVSGHEHGYDFTKVELTKRGSGGRLAKAKRK